MSAEAAAGAIGTAVLFAERGELTTARVVGREGSRYVLENLAGQRFAVGQARLFWTGRCQVASREALEAHWEEVRRLAAHADLKAAWEVIETGRLGCEIGTVATYALPARIAPVRALAEEATALATFSDTTYFRVKERALVREPAADVAATLAKKAEQEAVRRRLAIAIEVFRARLEGTADAGTLTPVAPQRSAEDAVVAERAQALSDYRAALIDVAAKGREAERWAMALPLLEALATPPDKAFDLLVRLGELRPETNLAPHRAGIQLVFAPEALAEAERLASYAPSADLDLTHLPALAIDDADTTDVDDAVALAGDRIYVMISDAAAWVQAGSLLDRVAAERTATVYLADGKLPMLPAVLSDGPLSLLEGRRHALAFSFELASDGRVTGLEIRRARITIARRLTYEDADRILAAPASDPHGPMLVRIQSLMDRHRAWRNARGAVTFQRPEVYFDQDATGRVSVRFGDPFGPGRQLVQEAMVATCTGTAIFCAEHQVPCIYRAQAPPDAPPRVADPRTGRIEDASMQYELLRRLKPSTLQLEVAAHWTLGVPAYTQVTSPIRRYADLLMHQQLAAFVRTGRPLFPPNKLQAHLFELGRRSTLVRRVEQESRRFFALRYLEQHPGERLTGTVLREIGKKTLLELAPLALTEVVQLRRRRPAGTQLELEVIAADSRADALQLKELT